MNILLEQNKSDIIDMYNRGMSTVEISKKYKCNTGTVWYVLNSWKVKIRENQKFKGKVEDYEYEIMKHYKSGDSIYAISKKVGISASTISRFLKRKKLPNTHKCTVNYDDLLKNHEQEVVSMYNSGKTCQEIADTLGYSQSQISILLQKTKHYVREWKYGINEHFFDIIDSEEKAYVLGWFYSDGCVDKKGKLRIQIQKEDDDILYIIKEAMEYDGPLYDVPPPKRFPHRKPQTCLSINRKPLADKLIALGCVPNKSLVMQFPSTDIVPANLLSHFVRGVFDGDGGISNNFTVSITCCDMFIKPLILFLNENLNVYPLQYYRRKDKNTLQMMIVAKKDVVVFLDWLYKDSHYYMKRKFEKYKIFKKIY